MGLVAKICMIGFSAALLILSISSVIILWGAFNFFGMLTSPYVIGNLLQLLFLFFFVIFCHQFSKVVRK